MTAADTVAADGVRLRMRPFRGRDEVAELAAVPGGAPVPRDLVARALERAHERGYELVVTPALTEPEWRPYLDAGFVVREHLHLLAHHLLDLEPRSPTRLRRAFGRDRGRVLDIDRAAFAPFWRLDAAALADAVRATPSTRFRISRDGTGYALTGRAGGRGYLQRLAVHPDAQGGGLGRELVLDALWWLRRRRAREAVVNTQVDNERARLLYERLGFRARRPGLAVLQARLDPRVAPRTSR